MNFRDDLRVFITGVSSIHGWPMYRRLSSLLPPDRIFAIRPPSMEVPRGDNILPRCITDFRALAEMVLRLLIADARGIFHLGGPRARSLHEIGQMVVERGGYQPHLLNAISRAEEVNGPPRVANVALNSRKAAAMVPDFRIGDAW